MMPDFFDNPEIQEVIKNMGKKVCDEEPTPIQPEEVYMVLSFYAPKQKEETIETNINEVLHKWFMTPSDVLCKGEDDYWTIGLSKTFFDMSDNEKDNIKNVEKEKKEIKRSYSSFIIELYCTLRVDYFCLTTKRGSNYSHNIYIKSNSEPPKNYRKKIRDAFEKQIGIANEAIKIIGNKTDDKEQNLLKFKSIHHYGKLVVRNIDCECELSNDVMEYANNIIEGPLKKMGINLSVTSGTLYRMAFDPDNIIEIPIITKKDMPEYRDLEEWEDIEDAYRPTRKVLGYYTRHDDKEGFCKGPHIVIGTDIINISADYYNIPFKVLFTKVLVHEFAHALMDSYLANQDKGNINAWFPKSTEARAMEESLANMVAIQCFKDFDSKDTRFVVDYIDNQPVLYRFGIYQYHINADWSKWRDSDKQNTNELTEWFNKCFANGKIIIHKQDYTEEMFNNVFK